MDKLKHSFTIGSDPEFLVMNSDTKKLIPAYNKVAGTKLDPQQIKGTDYYMLYDNALIEGNIPPANSKEGFIRNMIHLKDLLQEFLSQFNMELKCDDVGEFEGAVISGDQRAMEFGCAPYNNAWTWEEETAPEIREYFRPVGFHIHMGYDNPTIYPSELLANAIARAYDIFVVYPSLEIHSDERRWKNYGGYGKFREKPYGLEVRSLGGFFTQDKYLSWVFDQSYKAFLYACENVEILLGMEEPDLNKVYIEEKLGLDYESFIPKEKSTVLEVV
jgi:hypothetical protein